MKAYIEIDMPESCVLCELKCFNDGGHYCAYNGNSVDRYVTGKFNHERPKFCPLKEVDTIEANQTEIEKLQEQLEKCKEALQSVVDECVYYNASVSEQTFYKVSAAFEAIDNNDICESLLQK